MHNDGRRIILSYVRCISTSSMEEWKKLRCSLSPFFKLPDYHDNSKFLFNPLTYVLRGWGFGPAAEKVIGWGRVIERLHSRAAIGSWNLLICLHQSLPVRWLWHSTKSVLSILQSYDHQDLICHWNILMLPFYRHQGKISFIFFCLFLVCWKWDNHSGLPSGFELFEAFFLPTFGLLSVHLWLLLFLYGQHKVFSGMNCRFAPSVWPTNVFFWCFLSL